MRGQYEQAIRQSRAALKRDEKNTRAMTIMALSYYKLGKFEFAESVCDIALNISASVGECHNIKAFVALKDDNSPMALALFKKATEVSPQLGPAWLNLGAQYLKAKNFQAALAPLEKAAQLLPQRPQAYLNLGSAYRGLEKVIKAKAAYETALKLRGNNYPAALFNLGILYLDAETFPGMPKLQQLNMAVSYFNRYKQSGGARSEDDPVEGYLKGALRAIRTEQRRLEREKKRASRAAAKKPASDGGGAK